MLWTMLKLVLSLFLLSSPVFAQRVTPNFTTGSMTQTTNSTQTINETISIKRYGGDVTTWKGQNVKAVNTSDGSDGYISNTGTSWEIVNPALEYQLEIVERAAGIVETEDITRTITTTSTTTSLSVFSQ